MRSLSALVAVISLALTLVGGIDALPTGLTPRGLESAGLSLSEISMLERRAGSYNGPGDSDEQPGLADPGSGGGGDDSGTGSGPGNGAKQPGKSKGHKPRDEIEARDMANLLGGVAPGSGPVTAKPHNEVKGGKKGDSYGRRAEFDDVQSADFSARGAIALERRIAASGGPGDDTGNDRGSDTGSGGGSSGRSSDGTNAGTGSGPGYGKAPGKVNGHKRSDQIEARDSGALSGGAPPGFPSVTMKPHDQVKGGNKGDSYGRRDELEARANLPAGLPYPFPPLKQTPHAGNNGPKGILQGGGHFRVVVGR